MQNPQIWTEFIESLGWVFLHNAGCMLGKHGCLRQDSQCLQIPFLCVACWCQVNWVTSPKAHLSGQTTHAAPLTRCVYRYVSSTKCNLFHPLITLQTFLLFPCRSSQRGYAYYELCVGVKVTEDLRPSRHSSSDAVKRRKVSFLHMLEHQPYTYNHLQSLLVSAYGHCMTTEILLQSEDSGSEREIQATVLISTC